MFILLIIIKFFAKIQHFFETSKREYNYFTQSLQKPHFFTNCSIVKLQFVKFYTKVQKFFHMSYERLSD